VCAHALEDETGRVYLGDQQPGRFDVALPTTGVVPDKSVVPVNRVQRLPRDERPSDDLELLEVLAAALRPPDVLLELRV
jgi:hypothetical protein